MHTPDLAELAFSERCDFGAAHLDGVEALHMKRRRFLKEFCWKETAHVGNYIVKSIRVTFQHFFVSFEPQPSLEFLLELKAQEEFSSINELYTFKRKVIRSLENGPANEL